MNNDRYHAIITLVYTSLLAFIYGIEIVPSWSYMGFSGNFNLINWAESLLFTVPLSFLFKVERNAASYILSSCFYLFFIPSAVYICMSDQGINYSIVFILAIIIVALSSKIKINLPKILVLNEGVMKFSSLALVILSISLQAAYGGLENFSLNIERVYEFRRETASNLPEIFAYVYSNVASVLLPIIVVCAYIKKDYLVLLIAVFLTLLLFGMSHHKTVLFSPPVALALYIAFSNARINKYFPHIFLVIPFISLIEISYVRYFGDFGDISYLTSLVVRRVLFVPSLLDSKYIEFFSMHPYYLWSSSRLVSWAMESQYNMTAPFLIGFEYFRDLDTSANTGIIGSGYANAGIYGVVIYATFSGIILTSLNSLATRLGHSFVAAVSFVTIFNIISSADLLTSFLTHGLLLLLVFLMLSPSSIAQPVRKDVIDG